MIDHDVLGSVTGEYEFGRGQSKLGLREAILMVIKAVVSLALFGYHSVYLSSGYLLAPAVGAVFMGGIGYGCIRSSILAGAVEKSLGIKGYYVESLFELGEVLFPRNSKLRIVFGPLIFALTLLSLGSVSIAGFLALELNINEFFGFNMVFTKFLIYITVLLIIIYVPQPEKMKLFAYIALVPVIVLSLLCPSIAVYQLSAVDPLAQGLKGFDTNDLSQSIGYSISALEIIGYILNVRRMIKKKKDFLKACKVSFLITSLMYLIPGLLMYLRFGVSLLNVPLYYKAYSTIWIVYIFDCLMTLNFIYTLPIQTYFSMELLEKTRLSRTILRDSNLNLDHIKVVVCRIVFITLIAILTFMITDIQMVYSLSGILINSLLGLV